MKKLKYIVVGTALALLLPFAVSFAYERNDGDDAASGEADTGRSVCIYDDGKYSLVDAEQYVADVLSGIMNEDWNDEMVKVMAVIIRTGIYYQMDMHADGRSGTASESEKNLINESELREIRYTDEELLGMWGSRCESVCGRAERAAAATSGEVMTYEDDIIIPAYHLVSTGHTVSAEEIYGHDIPYLRQVSSDVDTTAENFSTTTVYSADRLRKTFQTWIDDAAEDGAAVADSETAEDNTAETDSETTEDNTAETGSETTEGSAADDSAVRVTDATQSGFARTIYVFGAEIEADDFKSQLGLQSTNIHIDRVEDGYRVITIGVGDSLGLSLYGASVLAQNGENYAEILKYYYNGITISSDK